jgi:hypothetical protein
MDGSHFDALSRSLAATRSRRGLARFLPGIAVAGPLTLLGLAESADAKKRRKKKRKKKRKGTTPPPECTDAIPCPVEARCEDGQCCLRDDVAVTCTSDGECCSGRCGTAFGISYYCRQPAGQCKSLGTACDGSYECCDGGCLAGPLPEETRTCATCRPNGARCAHGCCSAHCETNDEGISVCTGRFAGDPCTAPNQCQSNSCVNGLCT